MSDKKIKAMIANTFLEVADALETGQYGKKPVIGFASEGSEHGQDNIEEAMKIAEMKGLKAVLIEGEDLHKKMEECKKPIFPVLPSIVTAGPEVRSFVKKGHVNFSDEGTL